MSSLRIGALCISSILLISSFNAVAHNTTSSAADKSNQTHVVAAKPTSAPVNINTATIDELKTLSGIRASRAQAIIAYRKAHGNFKTVDELTKVKGFSEKIVAKLQAKNPDRIVVQ